MKFWITALLLALTIPYVTMAERKVMYRMESFTITSPAFRHGEPIPARYSCDGSNINPPLVITKAPPLTRGLALIADDPDAPSGSWVHWVVWNIPAQTLEIPESGLPAGSCQGLNDWKHNRYGGPCPPSGAHRYYFRLYALDTELQLAPSTTKSALEKAMRGHILAQAELMGTYRRR